MEEDKLTRAIIDAQNSLNKAFGDTKKLKGNEYGEYLDIEHLITQYSSEVTQDIISGEFSQIAKSIRNMRSSFLPVSYFLSPNDTLQAELADDITNQESYENAFMRMLGMPSVGTSQYVKDDNDALIQSSEKIKILNLENRSLEPVSFEIVRDKVLKMRQRDRSEREVAVDNEIYNEPNCEEAALAEIDAIAATIDEMSSELSNENVPDTLLGPKIHQLSDDFWKFSYLLFPPIQDIEISKCISEPSKIVAPNFSNTKNREINSVKIRSSLLESIIRIRLDQLSGTDTFIGETSNTIAEINSSEPINSVNPNNYGILESLFILRLRSSVSGLAKKSIRDIDAILSSIEKHGMRPMSLDSDSRGAQSNRPNSSSAVMTSTTKCVDSITSETEDKLNTQKLIEDSIMILLGDNSEILDLQTQTQRSSSMHDAHLMSGLISIVDIPRKRIVEDIANIAKKKDVASSASIEQTRESISGVLGVDIGIGTIDIAVFCLALFTIKENFLLGLLTNTQYDNIKNGEFSAVISNSGIDKAPLIDSINELSELIYCGYSQFISELNDQSA
jgi:hypothetical protein